MLYKCLILFFWTIPLMIITNEISEYFNNFNFKNKLLGEREKYRFLESFNGAVFVVSTLVFFITLIFTVYIYIFK